MNELRGGIPKFEPVSKAFKKPDHWLYQKEEQLTFIRPLKEPTYIPPRPVLPIFKTKTEPTVEEDDHEEQPPTSTTGTSEYEEDDQEEVEEDEYEAEYEDSDGWRESEYETEMTRDDGFAVTSSILVPPSAEEPLPNFGSPPSLVEICLRTLAQNFSTMWKYVKYFPESTLKNFSSYLDLKSIDVGLAARAIHVEAFWKRMTKGRWIGYHKPWAHGRSWKIYFLQKYLAEVIAGSNPDVPHTRKVLRLVRRVKKYIYSLDIKQLSAPPWPVAVDADSSTDTAADTGDEIGVISDMSLTQYLNRHVNFFPNPSTTDRLPLQPIFQRLPYLTHLTLSLGFDNYHLHRDYKFSRISDEDASNLAQALAACTSLYCFKFTRSKVTPQHLETIIFGLSELPFFKEAEFSHLFLTDEHMVSVTGLLLMKNHIRVLSLKNNNIGSEGFIRLLHAIILKDCKLRILDVSTNPAIGDPGGVALAALLAKKKRYLKRVIMSGTGLTFVSGYNFGVVLYFNETLEVLDLSVNEFSDFAAESMLKGLEHNYTLKRLDVRECGIPFTTVREMERICYNNTEAARKRDYVHPVVHPPDFWSGFNELDAELTEDVGKPQKTDEEWAEEEESVTKELLQIFVWATAQMKPRNRLILVRDIHAFMKKTNFVTGFDAVIDKLILNKQKETIAKNKLESKREKEERIDSSTTVDFSMAEFQKKSNEKIKLDFIELEAMQVLKDVNRCGRIDELFKTVKSEKIDGILKQIGKTLDADSELLSAAGMSLPFAKKWYRGFPCPESEEEYAEEEEDADEDEEGGEEEEYGGEEYDEELALQKSGIRAGSSLTSPPEKVASLVKELFQRKSVETARTKASSVDETNQQQSSPNIAAMSSRVKSILPSSGAFPFRDEAAFQAARDKFLGIRTKFRKWPKDGPPKFPKVVPYEVVKDCNEELPDTEAETEDDFPYWLDQWAQKY